MLSSRNTLILSVAALGVASLAGCWVGSSSSGGPSFGGFTSAGASAGGATSMGGAPTAGAPAAGAPSAGAPGGGDTSMGGAATGGAPAGGAPAGGAPAGGDTSGGAPAGGGGATGMAGAAGAAQAGAGGGGSCPAPTGAHQTTALDRSCWIANASDCAMTAANMNPPVGALDGSATTRFSTGLTMVAETAPFTYQVDMSSAVMITGVKVDSTNAAGTDYALMLQVDVSTDGTTWTPVACGAGAVITDFSFAAVSARYVRVTQSGSAATGPGSGWWSIYEFNVYGSTGSEKACATAGAGPTGPTCTNPHTT